MFDSSHAVSNTSITDGMFCDESVESIDMTPDNSPSLAMRKKKKPADSVWSRRENGQSVDDGGTSKQPPPWLNGGGHDSGDDYDDEPFEEEELSPQQHVNCSFEDGGHQALMRLNSKLTAAEVFNRRGSLAGSMIGSNGPTPPPLAGQRQQTPSATVGYITGLNNSASFPQCVSNSATMTPDAVSDEDDVVDEVDIKIFTYRLLREVVLAPARNCFEQLRKFAAMRRKAKNTQTKVKPQPAVEGAAPPASKFKPPRIIPKPPSAANQARNKSAPPKKPTTTEKDCVGAVTSRPAVNGVSSRLDALSKPSQRHVVTRPESPQTARDGAVAGCDEELPEKKKHMWEDASTRGEFFDTGNVGHRAKFNHAHRKHFADSAAGGKSSLR